MKNMVRIYSVVFSPRHSESKLSLCSRLGENIRMNVKSTLQLFVLFLSLSFAGNLWAQQVSSQNTIYAYKIQNQADGRAYYFVATTDGGQQRIKTSNNGTLTNSNDAYWYFVQDGSGVRIVQLTTGLYVNYPDMDIAKDVNDGDANTSTTNNYKRHRIFLSTTPSVFRISDGGVHIRHASRDWDLEPDGGNGTNGNWLNFWNYRSSTDGSATRSQWAYTSETEIHPFSAEAPVVSMSGLAGGVNPYGIQLSTTFSNDSWSAPTFTLGGNTYCYVNGQLKAVSGSGKTTTNTWTIVEGGSYAQIDNNGVLQSIAENSLTTPQTVTVRLHTVCKIGTTTVSEFNTDYNITLVFHPAVNEDAFEGVAVSPSSATIDEGESVEFSAPLTGVLSSRTCPLYIEFAGENGQKFYKSNYNTYLTSAPQTNVDPGTSVTFNSFDWQLDKYQYLGLTSNNNVVTVSRSTNLTSVDQTVHLNLIARYNGKEAPAHATILVPKNIKDIDNLYASEHTILSLGATEPISGHFTAGGPYGALLYENYTYTSNNSSIASISDDGIISAVAVGSTTIIVQSYKIDGTAGLQCTVYVDVQTPAAKPTFSKSGTTITVTSATAGATIYYTLDGSEPTLSSNQLTNGRTVTVNNGVTLKAAAANLGANYLLSPVATMTNGDGTTAPYPIMSVSDLAYIAQSGNGSKNYQVQNDIDASGFNSNITGYSGTFDGNFYTISGLSRPLFSTINGGTVKNVILDDVAISSGTDVGAIAGSVSGASKIYNCGVLGGSVSGTGSVGGLIGTISGDVKVVNNYNYAAVNGGTYAAGVVGSNLSAYLSSNWNDEFAQGALSGQPGIVTYEKDKSSNETSLYGMQAIPDWTVVANGDGKAAGVVAYDQNFWIGGNSDSYKPPTAGPSGTNGYALGMVAVWQQSVQYTHVVSLPAGNYILEVPVYNTAGTTAFAQNLIGVTINGNSTYATATTYPVGTWTYERVAFSLNQQRNVTVSVGYTSANQGSGAMPHLFFDRVKITPALNTMVANCINYGTTVTGTHTYPVYGGSDLDNKTKPLYDFFLYDGALYREHITSTNGALPAEARFLNRFEYIRATLNAERKLAAYYLFGNYNATSTAEIGKWVLDTTIAPYPVIKPWGKYPSLTNPDYSNRTVGTLSVTINNGGTTNITLPITDQNEQEFDYGYHKVQLPYYNDYYNNNYQANRVVTGWKITNVTGGTAGSFTTSGNDAYNFADRNCTNKDRYSVSGRVFAQGGFYYVPEGVTAITIEPYWANDVVYAYDPNLDKVFGMGYSESNYGPTYTPSFSIPSGAKTATSLRDAYGQLGTSSNVYDHAIVLVGNLNFRRDGQPFDDYAKAYTIMSIDEDHDNEPDYCEIYGHVNMQNVPPTRLDFVYQVGISWVKKPMGETLQSYSGIAMTSGHFEITETAFARFTEFETGRNTNYSASAPLIFNAGLLDQFVMSRYTTTDKVNYAIVGGHTFFNAYAPGSHTENTQKTTYFPVSVMGGEYKEFYLTGRNAKVTVDANNNGRVYTNGGKMGTFAGGYWEQLNGNAYIRFDHTTVTEFYGGSINPAKPITGNIDIIINNCDVEFFCGGPKAGNMTSGKTVTTVANNTTFGTYVGAGYGGSSVARVEMVQNVNGTTYADYKDTYFGSYFDNNEKYLKYDATGDGILISYFIEYMPGSGGMGSSLNPTHVTRFANEYAQLSLARTYNVTSTLNGCTITGNFYGGPWSGTVGESSNQSTVTSTLTDCTVNGSVFGGGKSAEIPTITVYPQSRAQFKTPLYNGQFGVYYQQGEDDFPVYPTGIEYTWVEQTHPGNPQANATNHTLETNVDLDNLGTIFGNTVLTINGGTIYGNVFGAGDASKVAGNTNLTLKGGSQVLSSVYGGGNEAQINGTTNVLLQEESVVSGNVFGGGKLADVGKDVTVTLGSLGSTSDHPVVDSAIYGGGALANTNTTSGSTVVNLYSGTVTDVYGGGLGRLADSEHGIVAVAAFVNGNTTVTLNGSIVPGNIFGGNNLNGSPKKHIKVEVDKTVAPSGLAEGDYHVTGVYGGGNLADYSPTTAQAPEVVINNCASSIKDVYGGGNAAAVPATNVTINGGDIDRAFAGGNGESGVAADVNGDASLVIHGGIINQVFGGSNSAGLISGTSTVTLSQSTPPSSCFNVAQLFAGGNEAYGNGGTITIGCGAEIADVYGGANKADIGTPTAPVDITLNITGGNIHRVFGGNNQSGNIYGKIVVNVNVEDGCDNNIDYVYGGGNQAVYEAPVTDATHYVGKGYTGKYPEVNIIKGHINYDVYGGGLGVAGDPDKGKVVGNPQVKIYKGQTGGKDNVTIGGNVFGGGNAGKVMGSTNVVVGVESASE